MKKPPTQVDRRDAAYAAFKASPKFLAMKLAQIFQPIGTDPATRDARAVLHDDVVDEITPLIGPGKVEFLEIMADRILYFAEKEFADERIREQKRTTTLGNTLARPRTGPPTP